MAKRKLVQCPDCRSFIPHWHEEQFCKPLFWKKPKKIFIQSMGDLFGDWELQFNIEEVLRLNIRCPQHTFIYLTKNPKRLTKFAFPDNAWVGVTATDQAMAETAVRELAKVKAKVKFLSCEPLLGEINVDLSGLQWLIIGCQTGPKAIKPELGWILRLIDAAQQADAPYFLKNNLKKWMPIKHLRQEWPRER
jgi:protein gp37